MTANERNIGGRVTLSVVELTLAITGTSGAIYAHRTLIHLAASGVVERLNLIVSGAAKPVAMVELGLRPEVSARRRAYILPASPRFEFNG
jgi:3-polyprenyl-4-hydroxybenzoate decarboxylase